MRELKYYKDLPVRSINQIDYPLSLTGADCYIDVLGNKYAFISFRNATKKPFYSLYLLIKEYNSSGSLIKETKFSVPNTYAKRGLFVTPEPVPIELECEGIEVFIQMAEFAGKTFYNDSWTKRGAEVLFATPRVTSTSSVPFEVQPTKDELLAEARGENEPKPVEEPTQTVEETPITEESSVVEEEVVAAPSEEEKAPVEESSEPVVEQTAEEVPAAEPVEPKEPEFSETKVYEYKNTTSGIILPIVLGVCFLLAVLFVVLDYVLVKDYFMELYYRYILHRIYTR